MMAAAVVSAVRNRLSYLAEAAKLKGNLKLDIEQLLIRFTFVESFLKTNDPSRTNNDTALEKIVIETAYNVEELVETAAYGGNTFLVSVINYIRHKDPRHIKIVRIMALVKEKMDNLIKLFRERDITQEEMRMINSICSTSSLLQVDERDHHHHGQKTNIVGIDKDVNKLRGLLLNDEAQATTCIWGMGGIGKTILARTLFDDPSTAIHFDSRAWVHIGRDFKARDIAATIFVDLSSSVHKKEEIAKMETTQLMEHLHKVQKERRCFVVLDDVLSEDAWDTIRFAIPLYPSTKILITTRNLRVAEQANGYIHEMTLLSDEQSWELFRTQSREQLDDQEKEIGKQIVRECKGLPLAIIVMGSLLRQKRSVDWVKARDVLIQERDQDSNNKESAHDILALSYNDLPYELKPCFLYFGHFPPDEAIPVQKLYLLWMAEGLIDSTNVSKRRMDVAEDYLQALNARNLVMVNQKDFSDHKYCKLHDLIQDMCISKGKEEGFLGVVDYEQEKNNVSLMRRIVIYIDTYNDDRDGSVSKNISNEIRSLLFVERDGSQPKSAWPKEAANLGSFPRLRVLDFDGVNFKVRKLPRGIEKLLYLRYLSFRGSYLQELPSSLTNFPCLETLDLCVRSSCKMIIPNILNNFSCLRHLYFPKSFQSASKDKLKLDGLIRLEILENFNSSVCDADDLQKLKKLQIIKGITADGNDDDLKKILDFTHGNQRLRHSSLIVKNYDCYSKERLSIASRLLKDNSFTALDIEGRLGALPNAGIGFAFTDIVFNGSEFSEDPMPLLGKLPKLSRLVLCEDAFVGAFMVCKESDFLELRCLKLVSLSSLVQWEVKSGTMPRLSSLTIEKCKKLEGLSEELMDIETLEEVKIGSMKAEFKVHIRKMAEEQRSPRKDLFNFTFYD